MTCREEGTEGWAPVPPDDSWQPRCGDWWRLWGEEQLRVGRPPARLFLTEGTLWKCCCVTKGVCFSSYWRNSEGPSVQTFRPCCITERPLVRDLSFNTHLFFFLWLSRVGLNAFKTESGIGITLTVDCTTTETRFTHLCWLHAERYARDTRGKFTPHCVGEFVVLVQAPVGISDILDSKWIWQLVLWL